MSISYKSIKKLLLPLAVLIGAGAGFMALVASKPARPPAQAVEKTWVVAVETVTIGHYAPVLTLLGTVESPQTTRIAAPIAANVKKLHVLEGETIQKNQPLATLDDRDYHLLLRQREAELLEVEAQMAGERHRHANDLESLKHEEDLVELSRRAVARELDLQKKHLGTDARSDAARQVQNQRNLTLNQRRFAIRDHSARLSALEARRGKVRALRDRAMLDLARTRVNAPFRGRIAETMVAPGDRVRVGDPLVEFYALETLEIRAQIPTRHIGPIKTALAKGKRLDGAATDAGTRSLPVELARLGGKVNRGGGGLDGLFAIQEGKDLLSLGQTVTLRLTLPQRENVAAVPLESVYGTNRIYTVVAGRMHGISVERVGELTGPENQGLVLVRSPELKDGDKVIVTQLPNAIEGLKVRTAGSQKVRASDRHK